MSCTFCKEEEICRETNREWYKESAKILISSFIEMANIIPNFSLKLKVYSTYFPFHPCKSIFQQSKNESKTPFYYYFIVT